MESYYLDKYIATDTEYETDARQALIVKKVGTDSSSEATLSVDKKECLSIIVNLAPLRKTDSVIVGPFDLGDYYIVIPPETKFEFSGASGSYMRLIGELLQLGPGESIPSAYASRYEEQSKRYITYLSGTYDHGTDTAWAADDENEVVSLTPKTIEKYTLDSLLMLEKSGGTFTPRMFALLVYIDNSPLEFIWSTSIREGIDVYSLVNYDEPSSNEEPWVWKPYPIVVEGDHTLSLRIKNISGSDQSPASSDSWTFSIWTIAKYERTG